MATAAKDLSDYDHSKVPDGSGMKIAIALAEWNWEITSALFSGARETLLKHGVKDENIITEVCPGAFELPLTAQLLIEKHQPDAVITIGCVIQGETRHFDFVCNGVTQGVMDLGLKTGTPVIFCVLTDNTQQQSLDRAGGKHGNKGVESAVAALQMAEIRRQLKS